MPVSGRGGRVGASGGGGCDGSLVVQRSDGEERHVVATDGPAQGLSLEVHVPRLHTLLL